MAKPATCMAMEVMLSTTVEVHFTQTDKVLHGSHEGYHYYTGCSFNSMHSKLDSIELGMLRQHIKRENLNGAHNFLVDAKAQADILAPPVFVPHINKNQSIQEIDSIFSKTQVREWQKEIKPLHPIHAPWIDLSAKNSIPWEPTSNDRYTGSS